MSSNNSNDSHYKIKLVWEGNGSQVLDVDPAMTLEQLGNHVLQSSQPPTIHHHGNADRGFTMLRLSLMTKRVVAPRALCTDDGSLSLSPSTTTLQQVILDWKTDPLRLVRDVIPNMTLVQCSFVTNKKAETNENDSKIGNNRNNNSNNDPKNKKKRSTLHKPSKQQQGPRKKSKNKRQPKTPTATASTNVIDLLSDSNDDDNGDDVHVFHPWSHGTKRGRRRQKPAVPVHHDGTSSNTLTLSHSSSSFSSQENDELVLWTPRESFRRAAAAAAGFFGHPPLVAFGNVELRVEMGMQQPHGGGRVSVRLVREPAPDSKTAIRVVELLASDDTQPSMAAASSIGDLLPPQVQEQQQQQHAKKANVLGYILTSQAAIWAPWMDHGVLQVERADIVNHHDCNNNNDQGIQNDNGHHHHHHHHHQEAAAASLSSPNKDSGTTVVLLHGKIHPHAAKMLSFFEMESQPSA